MAGTKATKLEKTENSVVFNGGNGRGIALFAKHDGYHYTECHIREWKPGNEFVAVDDDCNGGMDFVRDTRPLRKSDPIGNAEVYKSLLLDLERFLKAAVKALPR